MSLPEPFLTTQQVGWNENAYQRLNQELCGHTGIYEELRGTLSIFRGGLSRGESSPPRASEDLVSSMW